MASDIPRLIDGVRGVRYGEVIAAFARDGTGHLWVGGFAGVSRWEPASGIAPTYLLATIEL